MAAMVVVFASFGEYVEQRCPSPAAFKAALRYVWGAANREGSAKLTPPPRLQEVAKSRFGISDFECNLNVWGGDVGTQNMYAAEFDRKYPRPNSK